MAKSYDKIMGGFTKTIDALELLSFKMSEKISDCSDRITHEQTLRFNAEAERIKARNTARKLKELLAD